MIKQFRSLHPLNILFLIVLVLLVRLPVWNEFSGSASADFSELYRHLLWQGKPVLNWEPSTQFLLSFCALLLQAFLFNYVVNSHNLIGKASFMPALLFAVLGSLIPSFAAIGPVLISNFLIIWLMNEFLSMYRQSEVRSFVYNAGFVIGIGTIIYTPFVAMLPLLWIGLMIFRPFNWREWVIGLLGFLTVAFFLGFYYFWNNSLGRFAEIWTITPTGHPIKQINYWLLLPLALISILGFILLRQNFFRSVVHIRKSYQLLGVFFLLVVFSASPILGVHVNHYFLAVTPLAVLFTYYFMYAHTRWIYETLFLLLCGSIIFFQLFGSFNFF